MLAQDATAQAGAARGRSGAGGRAVAITSSECNGRGEGRQCAWPRRSGRAGNGNRAGAPPPPSSSGSSSSRSCSNGNRADAPPPPLRFGPPRGGAGRPFGGAPERPAGGGEAVRWPSSGIHSCKGPPAPAGSRPHRGAVLGEGLENVFQHPSGGGDLGRNFCPIQFLAA